MNPEPLSCALMRPFTVNGLSSFSAAHIYVNGPAKRVDTGTDRGNTTIDVHVRNDDGGGVTERVSIELGPAPEVEAIADNINTLGKHTRYCANPVIGPFLFTPAPTTPSSQSAVSVANFCAGICIKRAPVSWCCECTVITSGDH